MVWEECGDIWLYTSYLQPEKLHEGWIEGHTPEYFGIKSGDLIDGPNWWRNDDQIRPSSRV